MNIKVCVGSSCHLKGSYDVILAMKDILKKYDVEDLVELQASFCLGHHDEKSQHQHRRRLLAFAQCHQRQRRRAFRKGNLSAD